MSRAESLLLNVTWAICGTAMSWSIRGAGDRDRTGMASLEGGILRQRLRSSAAPF